MIMVRPELKITPSLFFLLCHSDGLNIWTDQDKPNKLASHSLFYVSAQKLQISYSD